MFLEALLHFHEIEAWRASNPHLFFHISVTSQLPLGTHSEPGYLLKGYLSIFFLSREYGAQSELVWKGAYLNVSEWAEILLTWFWSSALSLFHLPPLQ